MKKLAVLFLLFSLFMLPITMKGVGSSDTPDQARRRVITGLVSLLVGAVCTYKAYQSYGDIGQDTNNRQVTRYPNGNIRSISYETSGYPWSNAIFTMYAACAAMGYMFCFDSVYPS